MRSKSEKNGGRRRVKLYSGYNLSKQTAAVCSGGVVFEWRSFSEPSAEGQNRIFICLPVYRKFCLLPVSAV
jgi:hypothetical protein